ncbi:hypothetical protein ACT2TE_001781 [Klebsiella pneumoniae]|nr:hypothetical protein [Klebsiella pneumoniae]MDU2187668.1 hypothetical protein [Klebsiella pneumoniae]HBZ6110227.1 hypothetical protein [Klebsiella pneumoniae]HDZ9429652.1 hypothetical protein [Klebsiella pneumoniae]
MQTQSDKKYCCPLAGNAPLFSAGGTRIAFDVEENYSACAPDHILSMVML